MGVVIITPVILNGGITYTPRMGGAAAPAAERRRRQRSSNRTGSAANKQDRTNRETETAGGGMGAAAAERRTSAAAGEPPRPPQPPTTHTRRRSGSADRFSGCRTCAPPHCLPVRGALRPPHLDSERSERLTCAGSVATAAPVTHHAHSGGTTSAAS